MISDTSDMATWWDQVIRDQSVYRDGFCDDHGDTATVNLDGVWRCVICGASVERYAVVKLHKYDGHADRLDEVGLLVSVAPSSIGPDYDGLTIRFEDGTEIMLSRYQLMIKGEDPNVSTH